MENLEGLIKKIIGWFLLGFGLIAWGTIMQKMFWELNWSWKNFTNGEIMEVIYMFVLPLIVGVTLLSGADRKRN